MKTQVLGIPLHAEQYGAGAREMVLLHGWGCNTATWTVLTNSLKQHPDCRVTVLDFPGHGESGSPPESGWGVPEYAAWTLAALNQLGIEKCELIAHSFGARVAILLAAQHPERITRMLFTGAAGLRGQSKTTLKSATYKALKGLSKLLPEQKAEEAREKLRKRFGSRDYNALPANMRATFVKVVNQDLSEYLPKIQAETLLLWGEDDTETPLWMGEKMRDEMPNATLIPIKNAGHFAFVDQPALFLSIAQAYLFPQK